MNNKEPIPEHKFWEMFGRVSAERDILREQNAELMMRLNNLTKLKEKKGKDES
jgi:hypothetical protein